MGANVNRNPAAPDASRVLRGRGPGGGKGGSIPERPEMQRLFGGARQPEQPIKNAMPGAGMADGRQTIGLVSPPQHNYGADGNVLPTFPVTNNPAPVKESPKLRLAQAMRQGSGFR
jgi:hypothetical protein